MEWKDTTSYQHGQRGRDKPTKWTCRLAGAEVVVTCGHVYHRPCWVVMCRYLGVNAIALDAPKGPNGAEVARQKALEVIRSQARKRAAAASDIAAAALHAMNA